MHLGEYSSKVYNPIFVNGAIASLMKIMRLYIRFLDILDISIQITKTLFMSGVMLSVLFAYNVNAVYPSHD